MPAFGRCFLRVSFLYRRETLWATEGVEAGFDQFELPVVALPIIVNQKGNISIREKSDCIQFVGEHFSYELDPSTALFSSLKAHGKKFLFAPMEYNLWRAPVAADPREAWKKAGFADVLPHVLSMETEREEDGSVRVNVRVRLSSANKSTGVSVSVCWRVCPEGSLECTLEADVPGKLPVLPRLGLLFPVPLPFGEARYFGLGPMETYRDKLGGAFRGEFALYADAFVEPHIQPQESGNRFDTEWAALYDKEGFGWWFGGAKRFDFNVCTHTPHVMSAHKRNWELPQPTFRAVCVDVFHAGVGPLPPCGEERERPDMLLGTFRMSPLVPGDKGMVWTLARMQREEMVHVV